MVTGGLDCNNTAVGGDPVRRVAKKCWVGDDETNAPAPATYLSTNGTELMLNGAVYKTVGFNAPGMTGCLDGTAYSDATLDSYFASLRPRSLTRTWAFRMFGTADLGRVVMAAERNNQMLILSLADGAGFCEDDGRSGAQGTLKTPEW
jgi:mannan endo-1,4-beta-mannosidase